MVNLKKKLKAKHYEHISGKKPLVFISELVLEECSKFLQSTAEGLIDSINDSDLEKVNFLWSGVNWPMISYETYLALYDESEYAAWLSAFGYRANHFTVSVNHLKKYNIVHLNKFLIKHGYLLNSVNGEIKGSKDVFLEQSSTMANKTSVHFSDKTVEIPCCFYEFAQRYQMPNNQIFKGFIESSADSIFESTNSY